MKILTPEQIKEHDAATRRGAIEGTLGTGAVAVGASYWLNRRWAYYRSLPPSLKLLGVILVVAPSLAIQAERRGLEYDRSQWTGAGVMELERVAAEERREWEALSLRQRIGDWATKHQYSLIFGGWAGSIATAGLVLSRPKYRLQDTGMKVVQARMWAQGFTVGVLIVAAILSARNGGFNSGRRGAEDHSWASLLEEQEQEKLKQKATTATSPA